MDPEMGGGGGGDMGGMSGGDMSSSGDMGDMVNSDMTQSGSSGDASGDMASGGAGGDMGGGGVPKQGLMAGFKAAGQDYSMKQSDPSNAIVTSNGAGSKSGTSDTSKPDMWQTLGKGLKKAGDAVSQMGGNAPAGNSYSSFYGSGNNRGGSSSSSASTSAPISSTSAPVGNASQMQAPPAQAPVAPPPPMAPPPPQATMSDMMNKYRIQNANRELNTFLAKVYTSMSNKGKK